MKRLGLFDFAAIALSLLAIAGFSVYAYGTRAGTPVVEIQAAGGTWVYQLNANTDVNVPGPLGTTVVSIREGAVRVLSSPCPDKLCVKAPELLKAGDWNACLPNKVFIRIKGHHEANIDAVSF